ncbi:hypothetical protein CY35_01G162000, partial [Sphagnum magellanicum]
SLKIRKRKSVRTTTMDNSESNIDLTQILAALQHLQQENAVLRDSLACDVNWGEVALIYQFCYGLHDDVKDLLLTLADLSSFSEAITQAIRCDNRLFERRQEKKVTSNAQLWNSWPTTLPSVPQTTLVARPASFGPALMQIDTTKFKSLTKVEKLRRRTNNLCLYYGNPGHIAR